MVYGITILLYWILLVIVGYFIITIMHTVIVYGSSYSL